MWAFYSFPYKITQSDCSTLVLTVLHKFTMKRCHRLIPTLLAEFKDTNFFLSFFTVFWFSASCKGDDDTCSATVPSFVFKVISGRALLPVALLETETKIPEPSSDVS